MHKSLVLIFLASCANLPSGAKYNRKDWKHWIDQDKNCLNTRQEILKERSLVSVQLNPKGCTVVIGKWQDYYHPEVHIHAKKVDIDHLVPLKNAHLSGAREWGKKERQIFANDPENLVITNRSYNRQKGSKGIDGWLPVHKAYACKYLQDWIKIKKKYSLLIQPMEQQAIDISNCR